MAVKGDEDLVCRLKLLSLWWAMGILGGEKNGTWDIVRDKPWLGFV